MSGFKEPDFLKRQEAAAIAKKAALLLDRLLLMVQVCERLPAVIAYDEARAVVPNLPRAAESGGQAQCYDRTYHERAQG
jgi:hypothetical protein